MDYAEESLRLHYEWRGKLETVPKMEVGSRETLSLAYTPGVARPCLEIQKDLHKSYELTGRWNTVAVVTDGSAGLGPGGIGPEGGWAAAARGSGAPRALRAGRKSAFSKISWGTCFLVSWV